MERENFLDAYLKDKHEEAAADFDKGDDKDGRDQDDRIGEIHDMLTELLRRVPDPTKQQVKEAVSEGEHYAEKELDKDKEEKEDDKKDE